MAGAGPGDGHCATSGTSSFQFTDDVTEDTGKLEDKLDEILSFVSNLKGKGRGGKSKGSRQERRKSVCRDVIVGRLVMLQPSVGKRMLKWNSTGPRGAKVRPKGPVKVSGRNEQGVLGVSPAGKEKATSGESEWNATW